MLFNGNSDLELQLLTTAVGNDHARGCTQVACEELGYHLTLTHSATSVVMRAYRSVQVPSRTLPEGVPAWSALRASKCVTA